jgi:hypothetical protein
MQLTGGEWITGVLHVVAGGLEVVYDEPRTVGSDTVESSRLLTRSGIDRIRTILRPETLWTDDFRERRDAQVWRAAHPSWRARLGRTVRELLRKDPLTAEPLLFRYLGRRVAVEVSRGDRTLYASGLLISYDPEFLALADAVLPAETNLPLCPGTTTGAHLSVTWDDHGLHLHNRGEDTVRVLGIRTASGMRPWDVNLRPGFRDTTDFRRAPAGTADLVFESPVRGDAILSRRLAEVRGGSEGSIAIPALPALDTPVGEIPRSEAPVECETTTDLFPEGDRP